MIRRSIRSCGSWCRSPARRHSRSRTGKRNANLCFDLSGANVVLQTCNAAHAQQRWRASAVDSGGLYYFIINQTRARACIKPLGEIGRDGW